jgi:hypothetical protein
MLLRMLLMFTLVLMFMACTHHQTNRIANELNPKELSAIYKTRPMNLKAVSRCSVSPTVKLVNNETRNTDALIAEIGGHDHFINPKELNNHIIIYLADAYEKSGIKVDSASTKILLIAIDGAEFSLSGPFSARGAKIKLRIAIPEIPYTMVYFREDWSAQAVWTTMAYVIHQATWDIIADPTVQKYILCQ